jgi:hypothetical protein
VARIEASLRDGTSWWWCMMIANYSAGKFYNDVRKLLQISYDVNPKES